LNLIFNFNWSLPIVSARSQPNADHRCLCGSLLARAVTGGVELKCRRCKRTVLVPLAASGADRRPAWPPVREGARPARPEHTTQRPADVSPEPSFPTGGGLDAGIHPPGLAGRDAARGNRRHGRH
jgi:hypothetical protein